MQRLLLLIVFFPCIFCEINTNCTTEFSEECPYNPDADLTTPQIARRHGYPAESHFVVTEDGYILTLHRIPGPKSGQRGGQPVFVQHGLESCSTDWVIEGNDSLEFSEECPYNPDADLTTPQIARRHGYPAESHFVVTEDGYILTLHRIPGPKSGQRGGQPVFVQHGLESCSTDWVIEGNDSLAFMLADAGYDVWLGNARGSTYSIAHMNISIKSAQYWNFTFHEMGIYDLPAALYYVSNTTNKPGEIIYIGHSMGTTMFFVFAAMKPQAAKNVKVMIALAPTAYMTHIKSPIRYLAPFVYDFEWLAKYLGVNQFLPNRELTKLLAYDCELLNKEKNICDELIFALFGFNKDEFNYDILPVVLSHDPAGTSTKTVLHYAQEIKNDGKFQQYDYGPVGNKIKYGTLTPPQYKLSKIKVQTYLMYAQNDWLTSYIDVLRLSQNLTNNVGLYKIPLEDFGHLDFLFGKHAAAVVYKPLIKFMQNYTEYSEEYSYNYNVILVK